MALHRSKLMVGVLIVALGGAGVANWFLAERAERPTVMPPIRHPEKAVLAIRRSAEDDGSETRRPKAHTGKVVRRKLIPFHQRGLPEVVFFRTPEGMYVQGVLDHGTLRVRWRLEFPHGAASTSGCRWAHPDEVNDVIWPDE